MNVLVACAACNRQYDASELPFGALFHCHCGETVKVASVPVKDAAVVRCTACGAARQKDAPACRHCSADFTTHERDMHTICPDCMARISDRARFCHHCGTRIRPQARAGTPTEHPCPACGDATRMHHRMLGEQGIAIHECPVCAGLWLTHDVVEQLIERARSAPTPKSRAPRPQPKQAGPMYRRCPRCRELMTRKNFGRQSGVIVDICSAHGIWFDERELGSALGWLREGGEERAAALLREERRTQVSREALQNRLDRAGGALTAPRDDGLSLVSVLETLLTW